MAGLLLSPASILLSILAVALLCYRWFVHSRRQDHLPPGPRGSPIFGSLREWLQVRKNGRMIPWLAEQARYGEMTSLKMGNKTWILLNTNRVVNEIITKRSSITHERPHLPIAAGLVSRNKRLFLQKTEDWKEGRRLLHRLIMGAESKTHGPLVEGISLGLLKAYLDEPEAWFAHNYRYPLSIMHRIVTGQPLQRSRAELEDLQRVTSTFLTSINSSAVDFFPQLDRLPRFVQFWRPYWERLGEFHYSVFKHWWRGMEPLRKPAARSSFVRDLVLGGYSGTEEQAMYITMLAMAAGSDNPRMTLNASIMALMAYPACAHKAREELDALCGAKPQRLPGLADLPRLPYLCAMVKEVLRWRPTVPLIPQRMLVEGLEFEGYHFRAGTEFLINSISVCRDGYEAPDEFHPERWLEGKQCERGIDQDLWTYAFGAGRRSCVGYRLAQKELFVALSRLIYCFDFSPAGRLDDTKLNAFNPGEPFPVKVTPRSPAHEVLIRAEASKSGDSAVGHFF